MTEPPQLTTRVEDLPPGIARAAASLRALGLSNLGKLIAHLPSRHERVEPEAPIRELVAGRIVSARGEITATRPVRHGRRPRFEAVLCDETGRLDLVWFNGLFMADRLHPGMRIRVQGPAKTRAGGLQISNPRVEMLNDEQTEPGSGESEVRPVYPAGESLGPAAMRGIISRAARLGLALIDDHLCPEYRAARDLPALREAYRMQHDPQDESEVASSRRRLAYDELLMLQLGVHLKRAHLRSHLKAPALKHNPAMDAHIRALLPFALTAGQNKAVGEIAADLARATPSNRLLQGDVGSGKTVVALYAMLQAVAAGHQASLMAPTELLAEQHFGSLSRMLGGSRVRLALLTGATPVPDREPLLGRLAAGEIDILVGTHALLTESVRFKSLALAVIDEQHRFGVHQRARLRSRATDETTTPHVLVMTATPIPRTLAITLFGDLDISTIEGLPPGRRPVETRVLLGEEREEVYEELAARVARGEQGYVVVPAIDAADTGGALEGVGPLRDVRTVAAELERGPLAGRRIAPMHGRLSAAERDGVMEHFRRGRIDVLVATTVIEVGVDVANATLMVVEQADRFGLAQLHQLRGRVGRGSAHSACWLIADPTTPGAQQRLGAIQRTSDGFALAELDLEIRGPGELLGTRQSGLPPFKVADLMRDRDLLNMARRDAAEWVARSPGLGAPQDALLRRRLMKAYGQALGLADVG